MNENYPHKGYDYYFGNSVRDWNIMKQGIDFAYFRISFGANSQDQALLDNMVIYTEWKLGAYHLVDLPSVARAFQIQTLNEEIARAKIKHGPDIFSLPVAIDFELLQYLDKHKGLQSTWPSVADALAIYKSQESACLYTNLDGMQLIHDSGLVEMNSLLWWIARDAKKPDEVSIDDTLSFVLKNFGVDRAHVLFVQTTGHGNYPAGASADLDADIDRIVSFPFGDNPAPDSQPIPAENFETYNLVPRIAGLNIRKAQGTDQDLVGLLMPGSAIPAFILGNGWARIGGYVSTKYLTKDAQPTPQPVPTPQPSNDGLGLYYLKTRPEWGRIPTVGTFAQVGGRGVSEWCELSSRESDFVYSLKNNAALKNWSQAVGGTVYFAGPIYDNANHEIGQYFRWAAILAGSVTGRARNMVKVLERLPGGFIRVDSIPRSADYSAYSPEKQPWLFGDLGSIYPDGHDGWDVHNNIGAFCLAYFDPSTFPGPAGRGVDARGLIVSEDVLFGPV